MAFRQKPPGMASCSFLKIDTINQKKSIIFVPPTRLYTGNIKGFLLLATSLNSVSGHGLYRGKSSEVQLIFKQMLEVTSLLLQFCTPC